MDELGLYGLGIHLAASFNQFPDLYLCGLRDFPGTFKLYQKPPENFQFPLTTRLGSAFNLGRHFPALADVEPDH